MAVKQMNTTKVGIKVYLDKAAEATKETFHAGSTLKRALIQFAADCAELKGKDRAEFCKQLDATPGWFGCGNNSACRQAFEGKSETDAVQADYANW